ncbi:hypothetical protein BDK51DRAFT_27957 [Blyttiomyces helicus]|uniref:Uncharacterized protein n=1 Tax=Blyttiomyces helicus TaxID=388810 RepID=A0A4P9W290_9FUNG|nr:hypothetical protein BDK51DRAFT_27957 [Blyttiomyces helicus]|eukprot:RKO84710.1 hypothetical protein BDK51DRAFT_27957 [Blyttiomyces helicus]
MAGELGWRRSQHATTSHRRRIQANHAYPFAFVVANKPFHFQQLWCPSGPDSLDRALISDRTNQESQAREYCQVGFGLSWMCTWPNVYQLLVCLSKKNAGTVTFFEAPLCSLSTLQHLSTVPFNWGSNSLLMHLASLVISSPSPWAEKRGDGKEREEEEERETNKGVRQRAKGATTGGGETDGERGKDLREGAKTRKIGRGRGRVRIANMGKRWGGDGKKRGRQVGSIGVDSADGGWPMADGKWAIHARRR